MKPLFIKNSITQRDHKSLDSYLAEIAKYDVLTPEQELELFRLHRAGDETAARKIVQHNLRFVVSVAKQYQHHGLWLGDLINEGNIGILTAIGKFDESKGFKFISYAVWWIRQAIIAAIANNGRNIRLPANYNQIAGKIGRIEAKLSQEEGREPLMDELILGTGYSKNTIQEHFRLYPRCASLDAPILSGESATVVDAVVDHNIEQPDHELVATVSRKQEIKELLTILRPREAEVIRLSFGLESKFPMPLDDIGKQLGISGERVRQIRDKSLRKLRNYLNNGPQDRYRVT